MAAALAGFAALQDHVLTGKLFVTVDGSYLYGIADLVIVLENNPRVILRLHIAERNLPLLGIERLYVNLNGIAYKNYL